MSTEVLAMMIGVSVLMGACGLFGVLWGLRTRQFEDYRKFLDGAHFDDEDALNDAVRLEQRKREAATRGQNGLNSALESAGDENEKSL